MTATFTGAMAGHDVVVCPSLTILRLGIRTPPRPLDDHRQPPTPGPPSTTSVRTPPPSLSLAPLRKWQTREGFARRHLHRATAVIRPSLASPATMADHRDLLSSSLSKSKRLSPARLDTVATACPPFNHTVDHCASTFLFEA